MQDPDLSQDERAELERLRAEVTQLRDQRARRRGPGWRTPVATLLIVLGCLLAPVSVLAVWSGEQISSTSRYVANVEPLAQNPAIRAALADKITNEITSHVNVAGYADQAAAALSGKGLPKVGALLKTFAPSIAGAVAGFIHGQVLTIVSSQQFAQAWVRANTLVHSGLVKALSGQGNGAISISNGQVTLSLGPFITEVKQDLAARGFTLVNSLPPINPTFPLFSAKYLVKAQTGYRLVNDLKIVLPLLAILLLAAGVYVARSHRRALISAGLGLAASMLLLGIGLTIFRSIYLNSVPASLPADAAAALFDTLVRFIKDALRALLVLGLVVAAGAFVTGPSVTAVRTRNAVTSGIGWLRRGGERAGLDSGPAGTWTYAHRKGLRVGAVAGAALLFVFWGHPTGLVVILIAILLLVALGLIELIGRPVARSGMAGPP